MGAFSDSHDVYSTLGDFFEALLGDPVLGPKMQTLRSVLHVRYTNPPADLTLDLTRDPPVVVRGSVPERFDAWMEMEADVGNRFWLGRLNVAAAMARGQIKARGGVARLMRMVPMMKPAFGLYEGLLRERGRTDLLETP
ncbi:MAG: sterol carrier protein [Acidimicrobiia bacterium]|nr:sterol carrier protein [Acidimicrobiia bacterium]